MKSELKAAILGGLLALTSLGWAGPVLAAQEDIDLLKSYVGDWRGRGTAMFAATGQNETVVCRMEIADTGAARVTFNGRCTLAGRTFSVAGTMVWNEQASQYEAAMSSVGSFQGVAVGRRDGDNIDFELVNRNEDGSEHRINADLGLAGGQVQMDLELTNLSNGEVTIAYVPFDRQ